MNDKLIQQGWKCPKCGRVYSPATDMCRYCWGAEVITTTNLPPMRDFSSHEKQESDE